ncbi:MAG: hypothetical protein QOJ29_5255, partial [Thermoleophilaceae bacterium]|nr:hypothetical protein [Thermoleophilaceae bacterium]
LTTSDATWAGGPGTRSYAWERCDATGATCSPIASAAQPTYTAAAADVGSTLRSRVGSANPAGSDGNVSAPSAVVAARPTPPAAAEPVPEPAQSTPPAPTPVFTQTADAEPVSGKVLVRFPGTTIFVALTQPSLVPFGSVIDVREGRVRLETIDPRGKIQAADFYGGVFKLLQQKIAGGMTELDLFGGSFAHCPKAKHKRGRSRHARKRLSRSTSIRHLWGTGAGLFRTTGRYSSATIRGTTWLTDDRCDGTLTRVTKGSVTVRDLVTKKSHVLRAPHKYLARAKR